MPKKSTGTKIGSSGLIRKNLFKYNIRYNIREPGLRVRWTVPLLHRVRDGVYCLSMSYQRRRQSPTGKTVVGKEAGFTLIELLVVISIVSFLSSIATATTVGARQRANNAYTTETVRQYILALELIRNSEGGFPATAPGIPYCVGAAPCKFLLSGEPYIPEIENDPVLDAKLAAYLPSLPNTNRKRLRPPGGVWQERLIYTYHVDISTGAFDYIFLEWPMEGTAPGGTGQIYGYCPFNASGSSTGEDTNCFLEYR